jgi:PQQ-like domain
VGVKKCVCGSKVAVATFITLCLAWCCTSSSPAASRLPASASVASATPGKRLWTSTLPDDGCCPVEAVSPDGTTVFISGYVKTHFETVAYSAATGARLWAKAYQAESFSNPTAITVSPDGARVYVTGRTLGASALRGATVAYDTATGRQLWASRSKLIAYVASGLAASPDGRTLYVAGSGPGRQSQFAVIAYAAATGRQRWLCSYTKVQYGEGESVAVSPDGKTAYVTGFAGSPSSALTVAYRATGTMKWAARYKNPYGFAGGTQIVAGPGGNAVYVVGSAQNKSGHYDIATFAYGAATGKQLWLDHYDARLGGRVPQMAVTPDGQTVIVTGGLSGGRLGYALASYNASTGRTQWTMRAPVVGPSGLVIDPHGNTMFVGGGLTVAHSVAHGTVLWTARYAHALPGPIALNGDGTRLFQTGWDDRGITTVAYHA